MAVTPRFLAAPLLLGTGNTTIFANPASQLSYVGGIILFNSDTVAREVRIWNRIPPSSGNVGTPASPSPYQVLRYSLAAKATISFLLPSVNPYLDTNRALIGLASAGSVVSATVCGAIETASAPQLTYSVLAEPIFLATGIGASTSVIFQNPSSTRTFITGFTLHNAHTGNVTVQLWHLVPPSSGSPGTPALAQQFVEIVMEANQTITARYPFQVCYEDAARSFRGRATVANAVSVFAVGAVYV